MNTAFIYFLRDPRDNAIRYVGKSVNVRHRIAEHVCHRQRGNSPKAAWINKLLRLGLRPLVEVVEEVSPTEWRAVERRWIAELRGSGCRLLNLTDGGDGAEGYTFSAAQRQHLSEIRLGRKKQPWRTTENHVGFRGRRHSLETKQRMAAAQRAVAAKRRAETGGR